MAPQGRNTIIIAAFDKRSFVCFSRLARQRLMVCTSWSLLVLAGPGWPYHSCRPDRPKHLVLAVIDRHYCPISIVLYHLLPSPVTRSWLGDLVLVAVLSYPILSCPDWLQSCPSRQSCPVHPGPRMPSLPYHAAHASPRVQPSAGSLTPSPAVYPLAPGRGPWRRSGGQVGEGVQRGAGPGDVM